MKQFDLWYIQICNLCNLLISGRFNEAISTKIHEPNGMIISTCTKEGRPSSRVVLLKGNQFRKFFQIVVIIIVDYDEKGFVFFTNYNSRKGKEISENPYMSAVFWWGELDRQVRVEGKAEIVSREETEAYFNTRPIGSKIGAWTSRQSAILDNRDQLQQELEETTKKLGVNDGNVDIQAPPFWGGVRIVPDAVEFWKGRPSRLNYRLKYVKQEDGSWKLVRLSP